MDTDFKLAFLNEDSKLMKTVPKAAPAPLKDEFKEIGKEIRDIVKAQSGRLEQYLVIQRKWPVDRWQAFLWVTRLCLPMLFGYLGRIRCRAKPVVYVSVPRRPNLAQRRWRRN